MHAKEAAIDRRAGWRALLAGRDGFYGFYGTMAAGRYREGTKLGVHRLATGYQRVATQECRTIGHECGTGGRAGARRVPAGGGTLRGGADANDRVGTLAQRRA
jgi:hypothetical protein